MHKPLLADRFGLAISFVFLSLFPSTSAWAQKTAMTAAAAQGPQQVIVSNTTAQPVPMVGLVTVQHPVYFQATQNQVCTNGCDHVDFVFNVPSGKTLLIRNVNVSAGTNDLQDTFGVEMWGDTYSSAVFHFGFQPVGGWWGTPGNWATNQQIQLTATQAVHVKVRRWAGSQLSSEIICTVAGEVID
jgi:hypothetical protein